MFLRLNLIGLAPDVTFKQSCSKKNLRNEILISKSRDKNLFNTFSSKLLKIISPKDCFFNFLLLIWFLGEIFEKNFNSLFSYSESIFFTVDGKIPLGLQHFFPPLNIYQKECLQFCFFRGFLRKPFQSNKKLVITCY